MPEPANEMELALPALAGNAELCRVAVAVFAAALPFTLPEIEQLKVAVSEAVGNCVLHAYGPDAPGRVVLHAAIRNGRVELEVRDWGRGIPDVARAREPAYTTSTDSDHIGLGFSFMEQFTDELHVESTPGHGTVVRMRKAPAGAPGR